MNQPNKHQPDNKENKDDALKKHLKEQFLRMEDKTTPPDDLKKEVFDTLDSLSLFADILGLFTLDFAEAELTILNAMNEEEEEDGEQAGSKQ